MLKTGYIEFARLESSADAIHAAIVSPAVAMTAEVHCQRRPREPNGGTSTQCLLSSNYQPSRNLYSPPFYSTCFSSRFHPLVCVANVPCKLLFSSCRYPVTFLHASSIIQIILVFLCLFFPAFFHYYQQFIIIYCCIPHHESCIRS